MAKIIKFERKISPEEQYLLDQGICPKDEKAKRAMIQYFKIFPPPPTPRTLEEQIRLSLVNRILHMRPDLTREEIERDLDSFL